MKNELKSKIVLIVILSFVAETFLLMGQWIINPVIAEEMFLFLLVFPTLSVFFCVTFVVMINAHTTELIKSQPEEILKSLLG